MTAVYDDPVINVLMFTSAVIRFIGNILKLKIIIGGKRMRNLSIIIKNKLSTGIKMFLVVGNIGESIMYPLPSNEELVYSPANYSSTSYIYPSRNK